MQTTTNPNPRTPKEKTWRSACHSALFTPLHLLPGGWRWKVLQEVLKWHCFDIAFFQVTSLPNPGGERFMPAVTVERTATASAVLFYDSETLNIPIPLSVQYVTPRWQHLHSSESHRAHCHSRRPGRCGVHGCISTRMHNPKIHTCEADKGTERAKVRLQWKAVTFYFLSVCTCRSTFSSLGSILSLQTSGRWIVPSAARRSEFHFANLATLSFSHAKQHKFLSPPDPWIVNPSSVPRSRMLHGDLCKKKTFNKKKRKEQWNDKPLRDCGRLSRHEWARVTLPQAVSPSISGSVTSSQPRSAWCFFPCSWWAAMAGSVKCTRLVHRSADGDLSRHRRAT